MRYRLMASYLGAAYQAAVGPTDRDITLFAAPPPPEDHGFSPASGGIWRKFVRVDELDALWESRPIGSYHGEPCLVLDDLGDRLHIVYLGMDERRAGQLGYWQVDRGVFEVVVARHEVTDLVEERHEFPIGLLLSALPRALSAGGTGAGGAAGTLAPGSGRPGNGGPGPSRQLPGGGQVAARNGQPMNGPYQGGAPEQQQAAAGVRQLAAGMQQPVTGPYPGQAGAQRAPQPPGGLAGLPTAVTGSPGRQALSGSPQGHAPAPAALGPAPAALPSGQTPSVQTPSAQTASAQQMPGGTQPGSQQGFAASPGLAQQGQQAQWGQSQQGPAQFYQAATPPLAALPSALPQVGAPQQPAAAQQLPQLQPPVAVAAWQGSPAADGSGTWYYQPADTDPQQNGHARNGYAQNGTQGYPQPGPQPGYQQQAAPRHVPPAQPGLMQQNPLPQQPLGFAQQAQIPSLMSEEQQTAPPSQSVAQPAGMVHFPPAGAATFAVRTPPVPPVPPAPTQAPPAQAGPPPAPAGAEPAMTISTLSAPLMAAPAGPADLITTGPLAPATQADRAARAPVAAPQETADEADRAERADQPSAAGLTAGGALSKLTGAVRGRRAARKPRLAMSANFADLVDLAHIPRSAYAVDDEVTGAMCLFKTDGGYEVFSCAEDARHEVRFFEEEEAAYFYLFGVLAAEALRSGRLSPRRG